MGSPVCALSSQSRSLADNDVAPRHSIERMITGLQVCESFATPICVSDRPRHLVNDVIIHPNQGELISCDQAGSIKQWDLSDNVCSHELASTLFLSYICVLIMNLSDSSGGHTHTVGNTGS